MRSAVRVRSVEKARKKILRVNAFTKALSAVWPASGAELGFPPAAPSLLLKEMTAICESRIESSREIVEAQTALFQEFFGRVDSDWKADGSRVTEADLALSASLEEAIAERFPEDAFLSEEAPAGAQPVESEYAWLVDPIDGTNNFARGLNTCSISVGLLRHGEPVYGCIYDHSRESIFHGGPNEGLWLDDVPVSPRPEPISSQSIVASQEYGNRVAQADSAALRSRFKTRALGSSALHLAYVATGLLDGSIAHVNHSWDIAAGVALLKAVGAEIHYFEHEPFPVKRFDTASPPFGYIAGRLEMIAAIREAIGR